MNVRDAIGFNSFIPTSNEHGPHPVLYGPRHWFRGIEQKQTESETCQILWLSIAMIAIRESTYETDAATIETQHTCSRSSFPTTCIALHHYSDELTCLIYLYGSLPFVPISNIISHLDSRQDRLLQWDDHPRAIHAAVR